MLDGCDPVAFVERMHARCEKRYTPCGDGRMVWRIWGEGEPVVLLHGGSGSWTHWIRNIPVFEREYRLYVADLPGLGDSDMTPRPYDTADNVGSTEMVAEIVSAGLRELLPPPQRFHLVGFSYGSVSGGYVARRAGDQVKSYTIIGAAALGVEWPGLRGRLKLEEPGMTGSELLDVQRHNLHVIMMATPPASIDAATAWLQAENTKRARLRTHTVAPSDTLIRALRDLAVPVHAIWGEHDVFANPGLQERLDLIRSLGPDGTATAIPDAGHWAMYEAAEDCNRLLAELLKESS
jgi:pimeloyl-ACP methyl ester carboxylesterase